MNEAQILGTVPSGQIPSNLIGPASAQLTGHNLEGAPASVQANVTHFQEAAIKPQSPTAIAAEAMMEAIVGTAPLETLRARVVLVMHVSEALFQENALAETKHIVVERNGLEAAYNAYQPMARPTPKKPSVAPGVLRAMLPQVFEVVGRFNGMNLAVVNSTDSAFQTAADHLNKFILSALPIGRNEEVAEVQGNSIKFGDLVRVNTWKSPTSDTEPNYITACLHVHAGYLYDAASPIEYLAHLDSIFTTMAAQAGDVEFSMLVGVGASALPYGNVLPLVNDLAAHENITPIGASDAADVIWGPGKENIKSLMWFSDILFVKTPGTKFGITDAEDQRADSE